MGLDPGLGNSCPWCPSPTSHLCYPAGCKRTCHGQALLPVHRSYTTLYERGDGDKTVCGIAGWVGWESDITREHPVLSRMCDTLACRGPDNSGTWDSQRAGLVHRRLIVVDPEGGGVRDAPNGSTGSLRSPSGTKCARPFSVLVTGWASSRCSTPNAVAPSSLARNSRRSSRTPRSDQSWIRRACPKCSSWDRPALQDMESSTASTS